MMKLKLNFILLLLFAFSRPVYSQDVSLSLNNYYSTPFGKFNYMRLVPNPDPTGHPACSASEVGSLYYNENDLTLYLCTDNPSAPPTYIWTEKLSGNASGSGDIWEQTGTNLFLKPPDHTSFVGILTDDPKTNLHLKINSAPPLTGTSGYAGIHFNQLTNNNYVGITSSGLSNVDETNAGIMFEQTTAGTSNIHLLNTNDYTGTNDNIIIDEEGNLGIGTTNPIARLHLFENSTNAVGLLVQDAGTGTSSTDGLSIALLNTLEGRITNHENTNMRIGLPESSFYFDVKSADGFVKTAITSPSELNPTFVGGPTNELSIGGDLSVKKLIATSKALNIIQHNNNNYIRARPTKPDGVLVKKHSGSDYGSLETDSANLFNIQYNSSANGISVSGTGVGIAGPPEAGIALKVHGDIRYSGELCMQSNADDSAPCPSLDDASPRMERGTTWCDKKDYGSPKSCIFDNTGGNGNWIAQPVCIVTVSLETYLAADSGHNVSDFNNYSQRFEIHNNRPSGTGTVLNTLRVFHNSPTTGSNPTNPVPLNWICIES